MSRYLYVLKAEIRKQHHHSFHSYFVFFSLLVWPVLGFFTVYFTYRPFSLGEGSGEIRSSRDLLTFLSTGYMAYTCFMAMLQSAWNQGWLERQHGTLDMAFLSPASRLAMMYGKALGALLEETWMFLCFCVFILWWARGIGMETILLLPPAFCILLLSATVWGGLMNTVFLFSRDATVLLNLLDDPMVLFSGVRIPLASFPHWARLLSMVFPLTYCLDIIRGLFLPGHSGDMAANFLRLGACLVLMAGLTVLLLKKAERIHRERGELSLF